MSNIQFGENSGIKEGQIFNSRKDFVDAWVKIGKSGYTVCLFRLRKIDIFNDEDNSVQVSTLVLLEPTR